MGSVRVRVRVGVACVGAALPAGIMSWKRPPVPGWGEGWG